MVESGEDLNDIEYNTLILALGKCRMLNDFVKDGKFKICILSKDHIKPAAQQGHILMVLPFAFPDLKCREYEILMKKLGDGSDLAWLRKQRKKNTRKSCQ